MSRKPILTATFVSLLSAQITLLASGCSQQHSVAAPPAKDATPPPANSTSDQADSQNPSATPIASHLEVSFTPGQQEGNDEILLDDTYGLVQFKYHDLQQPLLVSQRFYKAFPGMHVDEPARPRLSSYQFFVLPRLMTSRQELTRALAEKQIVAEEIGEQPARYSMTFRIDFVTDGLRDAACNQLNTQHPGSGVKREHIALFPYRYLEVNAHMGHNRRLVATLPTVQVESTTSHQASLVLPSMAQTPTFLDAQLIGTQHELEEFVRQPRLTGKLINGGYMLQEDEVSASLDLAFRLNFDHFLTGKSKWKQLSNFIPSWEFLGTPVSPAKTEISSENWVTRNQMRQLSAKMSSHLSTLVFKTSNGDDNMDVQASQLMDGLLELCSAKRVYEILESGEDFVVDPQILQDISRDQYEAINADIKTTRSDNAKDGETDDNKITWGTEGGIAVPKSIELYQFNSSMKDLHATRRMVKARAQHSKKERVIEGDIGPHPVELTIARFQFFNVDDDDEDLANFGCEFWFFDEHGQEIPGTYWKQERGLTGYVGDHNREGSLGRVAPEGSDAGYATDFFVNRSHRVNKPVSKIKVRVWAKTDDGGTPGEWVPFEKEFIPADGQTLTFTGGWTNGSTLDAYNGRHIKVELRTKDL